MINSTAALDQLFYGFGKQIQFIPCTDWNGPHHIFLQLANLFLFIGLCFASTTIYSLLFLRSMIFIANLITLLWIWLVSCQSDLLLWNLLLSLLLNGRISVVRNGITCHIIDCYQFLESPEWFGMNTADTYQVSFVALEESQLLVWNRDKLKLTISSDRYLQTILDHILGKDIVKKLMLSLDIDVVGQISEKTKLMQGQQHSMHHHHHHQLHNTQQILSLNNIKSIFITMFLESIANIEYNIDE
ncbi:Popeye domain-containing protein [Euroglyphus maynei]|uniref:Popeye domain-containing protein n=1 Tax=Euroglyphus maynei TaxID=6958 RepID=A0A1Y3BK24_EURMA|nr:Popeye domain-containing protein [Euroglyphus maynei]